MSERKNQTCLYGDVHNQIDPCGEVSEPDVSLLRRVLKPGVLYGGAITDAWRETIVADRKKADFSAFLRFHDHRSRLVVVAVARRERAGIYLTPPALIGPQERPARFSSSFSPFEEKPKRWLRFLWMKRNVIYV